MLRFYTAGESHGQALLAFVSGLPASLPVSVDFINHELHRRQLGYGRGGRQKIEKDRAEIFAGVRRGEGDARFEVLRDLDAHRAKAGAAAIPLLDAFDVHYYTVGSGTQCVQVPRMFWDPNFTTFTAAPTVNPNSAAKEFRFTWNS